MYIDCFCIVSKKESNSLKLLHVCYQSYSTSNTTWYYHKLSKRKQKFQTVDPCLILKEEKTPETFAASHATPQLLFPVQTLPEVEFLDCRPIHTQKRFI